MPFTFLPIGAAGPDLHRHGHRGRLGHRGAGRRVDRPVEVHLADAGARTDHPAGRRPDGRRRVSVEVTNGAAFDGLPRPQIRKTVSDPRDAARGRRPRAGRRRPGGRPAPYRPAGRLAPAGPGRPRPVRVTADTPYAAAIHWGWPGHGIRRQPWLVATWLRNPAPLAKAGRVQTTRQGRRMTDKRRPAGRHDRPGRLFAALSGHAGRTSTTASVWRSHADQRDMRRAQIAIGQRPGRRPDRFHPGLRLGLPAPHRRDRRTGWKDFDAERDRS